MDNANDVLKTVLWMIECGWSKDNVLGAFESEDAKWIDANWDYITDAKGKANNNDAE